MNDLDKIDTRTLSRQTREYLRRQCIKLQKKELKQHQIAELLGVTRTTVSLWQKEYRQKGKDFFKPGIPGIKEGQNRYLSLEQEQQIQKLLIDKTPRQLKFPFALWDRKAVKLLIEKNFGIKLSIRTVGDYLKRWNFTPQKPLKRAYEQNHKQIKKWLNESYPEIKKRAKEEKAEIHWGDETGLRNTTQHGRGYAPKGKTPVQTLPAKRVSSNLISTITNQGKVRFMGYRGSMNAMVLIKFLKRLIQSSDGKIFLILDNLRVHHAILVQEWLQKHQEKIEVFYLPPYAPEYNPDEYLNCDLKAGVHSKIPALTQDELYSNTLSHMRMLQKSPQRVKSYFKHPKIAYAAVDEKDAA